MIQVREEVFNLLHEEPHPTFFRSQQPHKPACISLAAPTRGTVGTGHRAPLDPTVLLKKKLVYR